MMVDLTPIWRVVDERFGAAFPGVVKAVAVQSRPLRAAVRGFMVQFVKRE